MEDLVKGLFLITMAGAIYLLPALIAYHRRHHQTLAITWLNILAGWTIVGWIVAFVWACTAVRESH